MSRALPRPHARTLLIALVGALASCTSVAPPAEDATALPKQLRGEQVVVTLREVSSAEREATKEVIASAYGLRATGSFPLNSIGVGCVVFEVPPERRVDEVVRQLESDRRVESVQLNQLFEGAQQEHTDPYARLEYALAAIGARAAHRISTGKGVRVTIVDTGVDVDHPDLRGRIAKTANFVDGGESSFATDRHGTAIAGIIGARADDAVGIFGVAPDAELIAAKACWYARPPATKATCSSWSLARAIDFAIGERTHVLNLSLTGRPDALLGRLLTMAETQGITVVAAAAEQASDPGFPATMESVVAVIASNAVGEVPALAWFRSKVAVAAPGVDVLTTTPGGRYDFLSGSSLAAAEVSGVVSLLIQQRSGLRPAEIRELLRRTVQHAKTPPTPSTHVAAGIVDACAALSELVGASACN